ncbi:MAG: leucine-rich repeat domain-containing protein [Thermoguttaceae bacterium]|nr:leucine-rich repeat domain-containing protein [Thermoguttaceae bacterium]
MAKSEKLWERGGAPFASFLRKRVRLAFFASCVLLIASACVGCGGASQVAWKALGDGSGVVVTGARDASIETLVIPARIGGAPVVGIDGGAFNEYANLKEVALPAGLQTIGSGAFSDCRSLEKVALPEGLQTIEMYAFSNCSNLQEVAFPEGLQTIGEYAFNSCLALEKVSLPAGLQTIDYNAFADCSNLKEVSLPAGLQTIGFGAFNGCEALEQVAFPEGLQTIETHAFENCSKLQEVALPAGLQTIGSGAFFGCQSLEKVALPEGLQTIDHFAFSGCEALEEILIPDGVTYIASGAFDDSIRLRGTPGSYAEKYANENDYEFEALSDDGEVLEDGVDSAADLPTSRQTDDDERVAGRVRSRRFDVGELFPGLAGESVRAFEEGRRRERAASRSVRFSSRAFLGDERRQKLAQNRFFTKRSDERSRARRVAFSASASAETPFFVYVNG